MNLPVEGCGEPASSSRGVFGGRGGGGGPGVAELVARLLEGKEGVGRSWFANLPASASGGGALNRGLGGDGARGGLGEGLGGRWIDGDAFPAAADFLGGGGAGGGPRFEVPPDEPVFCGLKVAALTAPGGGGGGAFAALSLFSASAAAVALFCSK